MRVIALCCALAISCAPRSAPEPVAAAAQPPERPRNVILIIGDGMGPQQIGLLELYARRAPGSPYSGPTAFSHMANTGSVGLSLHYPMDQMVADSACSATQLALGRPAPNEAIGVDERGDPQPTVLETAKASGKATGLVSDTRLTHATPAAFAAHVSHRSKESQIAEQMLATGPDVMLSGGSRYFIPKSDEGSRRPDERDLLGEARQAGYVVVQDRASLASAGPGKLLGLFSRSGMMDAIAERATRDDEDRTEPGLTEMAEVALERLSTDEDGFFLMIESGQIDWACHSNDAGWLLAEMQRADELVRTVVTWAEAHDDTLVVVTADHETGGFGLSYNRVDIMEPRSLPGAAFTDDLYAPNWNFGPLESLDALARQRSTWEDVLGDFDDLPKAERSAEALMARVNAASEFDLDADGAARVLARGPDRHAPDRDKPQPMIHDFGAFYSTGRGRRSALIARELSTSQSVVWATGTHTHTPVPVFAIGPGHGAFTGMHHHTDLGQVLMGLVSER